jgi:hypothetical protein
LGPLANVLVQVGGVDLSDHVTSVAAQVSHEQLETTGVNDLVKSYAKGLATATVKARFLQDFYTSKVHQTLAPLVGSTTPVSVVVRPVNAAESATNPSFTIAGLLFRYTALDVSVGDVSVVEAEFIGGDPIFTDGSGVGEGLYGEGLYGEGLYGA